MHGICFDYKLQDWFDFKIPKTTIPSDFIDQALIGENRLLNTKPTAKIVWLGGKPEMEVFTNYKKGKSLEMVNLTFHDKKETFSIQTNKNEGEWLISILQKIAVSNTQFYTFQEIKADFETKMELFELFWYSKPIYSLRDFGLLVL
ncbi:hypothetical protein D3C86_1590720 [compost metagenome]